MLSEFSFEFSARPLFTLLNCLRTNMVAKNTLALWQRLHPHQLTICTSIAVLGHVRLAALRPRVANSTITRRAATHQTTLFGLKVLYLLKVAEIAKVWDPHWDRSERAHL